MANQWQVERSGPGVLRRLLVPQSSTKPAVTAFLAGLAGAGAFVASLVLDWQRITVVDPSSSSSSRSSAADETLLTAGIGSLDMLGLVYILGGLGLLTILGSVLVRPESALRIRMGAAGLGVGLLGVLVAVTLRLKQMIFNMQGIFGGLSTEMQQEMMNRADIGYESGMFAGFAAVLLLTVAVWLAAAPAARAAARWAEFAAANPGYAQQYAALHPGAYSPLDPAAFNVPDVAAQARNGATAPIPPAQPGAPVGPITPPAGSPPPLASSYAPPPTSTLVPPPGSTWTRAGHVDELTVTPSEPLDPGTNPDVWRS
jgi:hypothetical protein